MFVRGLPRVAAIAVVALLLAACGSSTKIAKAKPNVKFIGVDQSPICIDAQGNLDTTFACKGDPAKLLPNYTSLYFQEDQPGYLVGMVSAAISKTHVVAAVGGTTIIPPVVRYIQGFELGAKAFDPTVTVKTAYDSTTDLQ